jgi:NtrC-family two-component system sensor histidine kinase KinB
MTSTENVMDAEANPAPPKIALRFERWLVMAGGLAALGWLTWQAPPDLTRPGEAALVLLFSALLVYYPLHLLKSEYFLLPIVTLGAAILFGATTAAWSASFGTILGYGIRRLNRSGGGMPPSRTRDYWDRALLSISRHNLALLLAFILTRLPVGLVSAGEESRLATTVWLLWQPLIAFACLDSLLYLIDSLLEQHGALSLAGRDLPLLILAEFAALPFIWITTISYPATGVGALVILGSLPTIVAMLVNGLENYQSDLIERKQELAELNQISAQISNSQNTAETLDQICDLVASRCRAKGTAIFLSEPQTNQVWLAHACQLSDIFVQANSVFSPADDSRAHCLRTAQTILIPNLRQTTSPRSDLAVLQEEHIRALGEYPLITSQGAIGYLAVYFDSAHRFQASENNLLLSFASLAALAVSNSRLQARSDLALASRAHQLSMLEAVGRELAATMDSERLFEMVLNYALEFTHSPWGHLGLYEPDEERIILKAAHGYTRQLNSYPVSNGPSGRAIRTRKPVNVGEVRQEDTFLDLTSGAARSELDVPLLYEGRPLGLLSLQNPQVDGFTTSDQTFISQLADQAAIAVANAELYGETRRRLREQSSLYLVSAALGSSLAVEDVLQVVARALQASMDNPQVGIYLWNDSKVAFTLKLYPDETPIPVQAAAAGGSEITQPIRRAWPEALSVEDLANLYSNKETSEPFIFASGSRVPAAWFNGRAPGTLLLFPLTAGGQRLGLLVALLAASSPAPDDSLVQFLRSITSQAALALQNALYYADVLQGRDRLAAILNSVGEGILVVDDQGKIILANPGVEAISGICSEELVSQSLDKLPEAILERLGLNLKGVRNLLAHFDLGKTTFQPKITYQVKNKEVFIERSLLPVWSGQERISGWIVVLHDVSDERRLEQARELITETLVHDLRSPLSAVLGAVAILQEDLEEKGKLDDVSRQGLQVAQRAGTRIMSLVESLLEISRMQTGRIELSPSPVNLYTLAASILADYLQQANELGIILHNEIPGDLPTIRADPAKLGRVFSNLLDNALKFTPSSGQVSFSANLQADGLVTVRISDTGPGIPEEFRQKIFERFTQVPGQAGRRRGSGLGLTFCRLVMEAHGGNIRAEAGASGGSVFVLTLPVIVEEDKPQAQTGIRAEHTPG